ncbi:lysine exporter LysO family protein [candidate division WOR-3 bacterium]|nr:lysine exporter LysO family protein [candidate division WOR-3 bacterium]
MKNSLYISLFFVGGVIFGKFSHFTLPFEKHIEEYILYLLMFLIGITIGGDRQALRLLRRINFKILLLPFAVIVGSIAGTLFVALFYGNTGFRDAIALGSGVGYYSLASVYIARLRTNLLGTEALLINIFREIFTLLATPFLVKFFGRESPIASGGATSMDTTLPVINKFSGSSYSIPAIVSGTTLTILVPLVITLIYL